jgi:hypothetical protein
MGERGVKHTWNDITGVLGVLPLDEAKAVHQLDLRDLASAMFQEQGLDVGLGGFAWVVSIRKQSVFSPLPFFPSSRPWRRVPEGRRPGSRHVAFGCSPLRGRLPR